MGSPAPQLSKTALAISQRTLKRMKRAKRDTKLVNTLLPKQGRRGAPVLYKTEYAEIAKVLCSVFGGTVNELAEIFHVDSSTIKFWLENYPPFFDAVMRRSSQANVKVMTRLFRRATGFKVDEEKVFYDGRRGQVVRAKVKTYYPPDVTAAIYWLNNRMPEEWKTKMEANVTGEKLAGDIYNILNVTTDPDKALEAYNKVMELEAVTLDDLTMEPKNDQQGKGSPHSSRGRKGRGAKRLTGPAAKREDQV